MEGKLAEKALYDAAARGDVRALHELLENDPLLLNIVTFTCPNKTPLHVAAMMGHLAFVQEILKLNPQLAEELDMTQQSSALHTASAQGRAEIVKELLLVAPEMCFSRDCQGMNPLHLAVMKGHVEVVKELVQRSPFAAQVKLDGGETVLHLCVKHNQLEVLKELVENSKDLLNAKDGDGNTILHMAVRDKQNKTIRYLVESTSIDLKARNSEGKTAFDVSEQSPSEMRKILRPGWFTFSQTHPQMWLSEQRNAIMVVAILMATMAFQAGVTPPGGVWQEDFPGDATLNIGPHIAGEAVMASLSPPSYRGFLRANTIVFITSLSTILLLISGLPIRRRLFMWILMVTMWVTITSIVVSYVISIILVTPNLEFDTAAAVLVIGILAWGGVMVVIFIGNMVRLISKWLKAKGLVRNKPVVHRATQHV